jgi:uncharacterized repeat protein (TIGR03943 family)
VNREAQGIVLFVFGGAVLHAGLTDVYLRYVRVGFRPFLLAAGVALIIAALATLWYELRPAARDSSEEPEAHGHAHGHREPRIAWLLVLPLFALIVVAPPALGSYAADRTGTALQRPLGFDALPDQDPLQLTVLDYAGRAVYDHGRSLANRRIKITGFVSVGNHGMYLTRMTLNCCAADAQPIKVALSGKLPADLARDTWVEVIGSYSSKEIKDDVNNRAIPYIEVAQITPIQAPAEEYES